MSRLKVEPHNYETTSIYLESGDEDYPGCHLCLCWFKWRVTLALPDWVLRPHRTKVDCPTWDAATVARLGRDWYWNITSRQYGFSIHDDMLSISYGRQTWDSSTEQRWAWFISWLALSNVRHSLYDL